MSPPLDGQTRKESRLKAILKTSGRKGEMTKEELRKSYLARRNTLSAIERSEASRLIAENLFRGYDLGQISVIHCFISIARFNEIDTSIIFSRIWREFPHVETVVPRVNFVTGEIESVRFAHDTRTFRNIWNVEEPSNGGTLEPTAIDMVLVPGLAFSRDGYRAGYGKGFYDRFLKKCRSDCRKIGLSFFEPIESIVDTHVGDVKVNAIILPSGIVSTDA